MHIAQWCYDAAMEQYNVTGLLPTKPEMIPTVDESACTGCALCTIICPEVFAMRLGPIHRVAMCRTAVGAGTVEKLLCRVARDNCPDNAIHLVPEEPILLWGVSIHNGAYPSGTARAPERLR